MSTTLRPPKKHFALDSRSAWVGLTLNRHQQLIPRETNPLGPLDYRPQVQRSHVSTPSLGGSRELGIIGHFEAFRGLHNRGETLSREKSPNKSWANEGERSEFMTIYHEHDRRQALDPKLRFCKTPGPTLSHQSLPEAMTYQGKYKASVVHFGPNNIPFGERNSTKMAQQDYDIHYESLCVRKRPTLGFISKSRRWDTDPSHYNDLHQGHGDHGSAPQEQEAPRRATTAASNVKRDRSEVLNAKERVTARFLESATEQQQQQPAGDLTFEGNEEFGSPDKLLLSQNSLMASKSKKTVLSEHHPLLPHKKYDDSCYARMRKPPLATLGPLELNKSIKSDVFGTMLRLRSDYKGDSRGAVPLPASNSRK